MVILLYNPFFEARLREEHLKRVSEMKKNVVSPEKLRGLFEFSPVLLHR